jgi:excisionase family DNA binding protein
VRGLEIRKGDQLTVKAVADRLEVCATTIYGLIASGKLKCYRIGSGRGVMRISEDHLAEYLRGAEPVAKVAPAPARKPHLKHLHIN